MNLKLTDEQVLRMGQLAVLASRPMRMGFLHYDNNLHKPEDVDKLELSGNGLYIDYYEGRMVKFYGSRTIEDKNIWHFNDTISAEYQSWLFKYAGYKELSDAAIQSLKNAEP